MSDQLLDAVGQTVRKPCRVSDRDRRIWMNATESQTEDPDDAVRFNDEVHAIRVACVFSIADRDLVNARNVLGR